MTTLTIAVPRHSSCEIHNWVRIPLHPPSTLDKTNEARILSLLLDEADK
jgi:hypothetical protein